MNTQDMFITENAALHMGTSPVIAHVGGFDMIPLGILKYNQSLGTFPADQMSVKVVEHLQPLHMCVHLH